MKKTIQKGKATTVEPTKDFQYVCTTLFCSTVSEEDTICHMNTLHDL